MNTAKKGSGKRFTNVTRNLIAKGFSKKKALSLTPKRLMLHQKLARGMGIK